MIFKRGKPRLTPVTNTDVVKKLLELATVKVGNGNRAVVVFFDLKCPFCARLFNETEDVLLEMARKGLVTYAMCDYVVHKDAEPLHKSLRCLNSDERLKFIKEVYNGKKVEAGACQADDLKTCEELAERVGVYGTPTILIYDFAKNRGYIHFGYMTAAELLEALSAL
ncbi:MAG: thioredoxin fold domain-containing protein [Pyrobaculum sp.]